MKKKTRNKKTNAESAQQKPQRKLCDCVEKSLRQYFKDLNGEEACGMYAMVLREMEAPLFAVVMRAAGENQSKACKMLGISRGTLRKKLERYGLGDG